MDIVTLTYAGQPLWLWGCFLSFIAFLLFVDLGLVNRKDGVVSAKKSALMWGSFAGLAVLFGAIYVGFVYQPDPAYYSSPENLNQQAVIQFFTGYLLETALAFDNIFVISLVFTFFAVPREYQHRVLFWGVMGAIVFRAIFIAAGASVVNNWTWVLYIFAAFLVFTGVKMLRGGEQEIHLEEHRFLKWLKRRIRVTETIDSHNFFVRRADPVTGKLVLFATPLFLALVMVEFADIIFAIDSVPAIFAVTRDPFIVYTSNIFAVLGLRSMYFMLAEAVQRFKYLKYGLSLVLILIGGKIIWNFGLSKAMGLVPYLEAHWSLVATLVLLGGSIVYSLHRTRGARA